MNVTHVSLPVANRSRKWMRNNIANLTFWHYQSNSLNNNVDFQEYKPDCFYKPDSDSESDSDFDCHIDWPGGRKPDDEPSCGFEHERCQSDKQQTSVIAAATLAVFLFCAGVITLSIYRKWKIEQEIEGLLWKIDPQDLHGYCNNDIISSPSKVSAIMG
jgi:hypothetical protein